MQMINTIHNGLQNQCDDQFLKLMRDKTKKDVLSYVHKLEIT